MEKLIKVQSRLKAPKNQTNKFGGYNYRSCEDILEAVKPLLAEEGLLLTVSDEIVMVGERYYIKATATVTDGEKTVSNSAWAREAEEKKGMDVSQITGSASSYARKYALNGLFCIDDTKDADFLNNGEEPKKTPAKKQTRKETPKDEDGHRDPGAEPATEDDVQYIKELANMTGSNLADVCKSLGVRGSKLTNADFLKMKNYLEEKMAKMDDYIKEQGIE